MKYLKKDLNTKIDFLHWFLTNHSFKEKQFFELFEIFVSDLSFLDNIHFVYDASYFSNSLIILSDDSQGSPFIYRYKRAIIFDFFTMKKYILHQLDKKEDLFIQINYKNVNCCMEYEKVNSQKLDMTKLTIDDQEMLDRFLKYQNLLMKKHFLEFKIDESLETKDTESFKKYSSELLELNKKELPSN